MTDQKRGERKPGEATKQVREWLSAHDQEFKATVYHPGERLDGRRDCDKDRCTGSGKCLYTPCEAPLCHAAAQPEPCSIHECASSQTCVLADQGNECMVAGDYRVSVDWGQSDDDDEDPYANVSDEDMEIASAGFNALKSKYEERERLREAVAEAAHSLSAIRSSQPRMVFWDAYVKWEEDVEAAVCHVENAADELKALEAAQELKAK